MLAAINNDCQLDITKNRFQVIYNAETLPLLIRKCIQIWKNYYTVKEQDDTLAHVTKFEKVFEDEIDFVLYKAVLSRKEANRHKNDTKLPGTEDILTFENYLEMKRSLSIEEFEKGNIDLPNWMNLVETTTCRIVLYNRRRVGEISKTLINDYLHAKSADPGNEFFKMLPTKEEKQRKMHIRIDIQGMRFDGKGQPYISHENEYVLSLIYKYRDDVSGPFG